MRRLVRWLSADKLPCYIDSLHKMAIWKRTDANGRPAMLVLNNSFDRACNVRLAVKGAPQDLTLTRTDLAMQQLKNLSDDGLYSFYEIDALNPWEMALVTGG
jgi:hypothetical protein